jgi:hypothetical protein
MEYIKTQSRRYFPTITDAELTALAEAYPDDITQVNHPVPQLFDIYFNIISLRAHHLTLERLMLCRSCYISIVFLS